MSSNEVLLAGLFCCSYLATESRAAFSSCATEKVSPAVGTLFKPNISTGVEGGA